MITPPSLQLPKVISPNQSAVIALFPVAWAKDVIAYSEHCDRPSCPEAKPDRPIKALRSPYSQVLGRKMRSLILSNAIVYSRELGYGCDRP